MGKTTEISWTESTWNPWHGCKKVSPGCKFCYMYRDKERYGQDPTTVLRSKTGFNDPLNWKDPKLIFTCSWSDWFIEEADAWRPDAWKIIRDTPQHTYQILTKRPERIRGHLPDDWGDGYGNVWLGVSCENQAVAATRIPILYETSAVVRFISVEPMLEKVDLRQINVGMAADTKFCQVDFLAGTMKAGRISHVIPKLDWVIVGGESGNENGKYTYRPCAISWMREMVTDCIKFNVPVFVKQMGTSIAKEKIMSDRHGTKIDEFPTYLQHRQFPKNTRYAKI